MSDEDWSIGAVVLLIAVFVVGVVVAVVLWALNALRAIFPLTD